MFQEDGSWGWIYFSTFISYAAFAAISLQYHYVWAWEIVSVGFQENWSGFTPSFTHDPFRENASTLLGMAACVNESVNQTFYKSWPTNWVSEIYLVIWNLCRIFRSSSTKSRSVFHVKEAFAVYSPFNQNIAGFKCRCRISFKFFKKLNWWYTILISDINDSLLRIPVKTLHICWELIVLTWQADPRIAVFDWRKRLPGVT